MVNLKKADITEYILHISELVTYINLNTNHEAFLIHYGHTKQIDVNVYIGGWKEKKPADFYLSAYYDSSDYKEKLEKIIQLLERIS